jgi:hypothetical protein
MGADQNFFEIRIVGLYPNTPQTLEPRSMKIVMDKLSQSQKTQVPKRKQSKKTSQTAALLSQTGLTACPDRSDRSGWDLKMPTGQTGFTDRSDRLLPDSPRTKTPNRKS